MESLASLTGQWKYKPGKGIIADPLSRMRTFYSMALVRNHMALTSTPLQPEQETLVNRIRHSYSEDKDFPKEKYEHQDGLYYSKGKIVIPNHTELRNTIMKEFHDSMFAGHLGREKTLKNISTMFTWKGMTNDVAEYVKQCHVCQTCKPSGTSNQGPLVLPEISETPWTNISVDLITGLPVTTSGHNSILTIVDRTTKMVHLAPTEDTLTAEGFTQLMQDHVFSKHGLPLYVIHDRDLRFNGHFFKEVCHL